MTSKFILYISLLFFTVLVEWLAWIDLIMVYNLFIDM